MKSKWIFITGLFIGMLNATTITTTQNTYAGTERVTVQVSAMSGDKKDWVGIYPVGSSNDWENVLSWSYTNGKVNGDIVLETIAEGTYEVRAFFKNSYKLEAQSSFTVSNNIILPATVGTSKNSYFINEKIKVNFEHMSGHTKDWVAIYPVGSSNDWSNVIAWTYTNGKKKGKYTFGTLAVGSYEARIFFKNSYKLEAKHAFVVKANQEATKVTTSKAKYFTNEKIKVNYQHMLGDPEDWVGIYPAGSSTDWENVISWTFTNGKKQGSTTFDALPVGSYEVRAFFNNSFTAVSTTSITVIDSVPMATVYEDAENGISSDWVHLSGNYAPSRVDNGFNSTGALVLVPEWVSNTQNIAEYYLPIYNRTQKVLEMDMGGLSNYLLPTHATEESKRGWIEHSSVGVTVQTTNGPRTMLWDSFFSHGNVEPFIKDYGNGNIWLAYPSPTEHVRGFGYEDIDVWSHFKVNVEAELKKLEPNNKITSIDLFFATGGFLDNLKLSSN